MEHVLDDCVSTVCIALFEASGRDGTRFRTALPRSTLCLTPGEPRSRTGLRIVTQWDAPHRPPRDGLASKRAALESIIGEVSATGIIARLAPGLGPPGATPRSNCICPQAAWRVSLQLQFRQGPDHCSGKSDADIGMSSTMPPMRLTRCFHSKLIHSHCVRSIVHNLFQAR